LCFFAACNFDALSARLKCIEIFKLFARLRRQNCTKSRSSFLIKWYFGNKNKPLDQESKMFSATGKLLPGSIEHPAMATLVDSSSQFGAETEVCTWNKLGYFPIVSTITGCARALLGIIHSIVHLASAIFDSKNRDHHLQEAKLGGYNIGRGIVEMIPVVGSTILLVKDLIISKKYTVLALDYKKANRQECSNNVLLFVNGNKVGQKSIDELNQIVQKEGFKNKLSFWQKVNLVRMSTPRLWLSRNAKYFT
jgi:hypothetical protein